MADQPKPGTPVQRDMELMRRLSPRRNSSTAEDLEQLVFEQLEHFSIEPDSEFGVILADLVRRMYQSQDDIETLWQVALSGLHELPAKDRISRFNAKKFVSFQLAKLLDNFQKTFRRSYQTLDMTSASQIAKGPYPILDNVTAIFSATPVITRTATYVYACAEWIEDAFAGKDFMLEIYSRLLNPTSCLLYTSPSPRDS